MKKIVAFAKSTGLWYRVFIKEGSWEGMKALCESKSIAASVALSLWDDATMNDVYVQDLRGDLPKIIGCAGHDGEGSAAWYPIRPAEASEGSAKRYPK